MSKKRPTKARRREPPVARRAPSPGCRPEADAASPQFRQSIMEVLDNQLRDGTPPETRQTLERLITEGHAPAEARRLIAVLITREIWHVLTFRETFDLERYVAALRRLPDIEENDDGPIPTSG